MMDTLSIWIAAFVTLAIFSFLYKENPVFRFAEHLLVGVSSGYYAVQYAYTAIYKKFYVPLVDDGNLWMIGGGILGSLMLLRFSRRTAWISRFALAFYVGAGAGYTIPNILDAQVLAQVQGVFPDAIGTVSAWVTAKQIMVLFGVLSVLTYFFFSREHEGLLGKVSKVGITFLMIGFGASFGYTIMGRVTLLIARFQFLIEDWMRVSLS